MSSPPEIQLLLSHVSNSPQSTASCLSTRLPTSTETKPEHTPYSKTQNNSSRSATRSLKMEEAYPRSGYESKDMITDPFPCSESLNEFRPVKSFTKLDKPHQNVKIDKKLEQHGDSDQLSIFTLSEGPITKNYCRCRLLEAPLSIVGRATRGYQAMDIATGDTYFLKDVWRDGLAGLGNEGDIVRELCEQGVQSAPKLAWLGEIVSDDNDQDTRIHEHISEKWDKRSLREKQLERYIFKRADYRMVLEKIGCSLHEHQSLRELLSAASDIYYCIMDSNRLCQTLHLDISPNNIILVHDPKTGLRKGVIFDWELSIKTDEPRVANYTVTGTWQFISYRLLQRSDATPHRIADDLESLFWVVCWFLLLYYADFPVKILAARLSGIFDTFIYEAGNFVGGDGKASTLLYQGRIVSGFQDPIVVEWIKGYAWFLLNTIQAPKGRVPDPMELESVFHLAGKIPQGVLKRVPDWKELKTYRPLGGYQLLPWSSLAAMSESDIITEPRQTIGSEVPAAVPEENAGEAEGGRG